jgi:hypothetical protein
MYQPIAVAVRFKVVGLLWFVVGIAGSKPKGSMFVCLASTVCSEVDVSATG